MAHYLDRSVGHTTHIFIWLSVYGTLISTLIVEIYLYIYVYCASAKEISSNYEYFLSPSDSISLETNSLIISLVPEINGENF